MQFESDVLVAGLGPGLPRRWFGLRGESCDYYDVLGDGTSVIDGYVTDRDKQGVAGTEVRAVGDGGGSALSGSDGYYAIVVKPGSYHVVPSGGPLPNDPVQLTVMPGQPVDQAVTDAPLASICAESISRIWPQGYLNGPDALPVDITTDANGHYKFGITVGSRPGVWRLQAWAETNEGLAPGPTASETKAVTFTSLGPARLSNFVGEVNLIAGTTEETVRSSAAGLPCWPGLLRTARAFVASLHGPPARAVNGYAYRGVADIGPQVQRGAPNPVSGPHVRRNALLQPRSARASLATWLAACPRLAEGGRPTRRVAPVRSSHRWPGVPPSCAQPRMTCPAPRRPELGPLGYDST